MLELTARFSKGDLIADQYRILEVAGAGGMGVVYRAQDIRLQRTVAIKVLPPTQDARDEERFLREARTACSLDHQNVGVIYEVGTTPTGTHFIAMAFYEGASLAERLQGSPLAPALALDLITQAAEGLRDAHHHGIVHRDIKPSNLMVTNNNVVKIVDFGLAQVASAATATFTGTTGTVAYMSPEQALGRAVDQRTDLWSLGVTFAEMLTGRNPFSRDTIPAIMFAILNDAPEGIETVPPAFQPILYRCLAKDPNQRYASADELLVDLKSARESVAADAPATNGARIPSQSGRADTRRLRESASRSAILPASRQPARSRILTLLVLPVVVLLVAIFIVYGLYKRGQKPASSDAEPPHVAVLPFENIGSNPANETLSAGLMDSLTGRLSDLKIGDKTLWVVPNSEVRRQKVADPQDALEKLKANLVVKGSIERDGQQVQLHVNLIDTKNLRQVGSVEVSDDTGDLALLENETVAKLAQLMHIPATADMLRTTNGQVNPAAYESYLTALGYMQRYDKPGNLDQAVAELKKATTTDPGFAVGFAALGEAYRLKFVTTKDPQPLREAEANASKAVELNSSLSEPYVTLGKIHNAAGKHDLAMQDFQRALALNARDGSALIGLAITYDNAGRPAEAESTLRRAVDLNPDSWDRLNDLAGFYKPHHRYDESIAAYKRALQITPQNAQLLFNLGAAYIEKGGPDSLRSAEQVLAQSIAINPSFAAYANLGEVYYREREYQKSAAATQKALEISSSDYLVWDNLREANEWLHNDAGVRATLDRMNPLLTSYLAAHPEDAEAQVTFANVLAKQGSKEDAMQHLRRAIALSPNDPDVLEAAATAYEGLGDRPQAIAMLKRAFSKGQSPAGVIADPDAQSLLNAVGLTPLDKPGPQP